MVNVLLVESSAKIQNQLQEALKKVRFNVKTTNWSSDLPTVLEEQQTDLVLIRNKLEDSNAAEYISELRKVKKYSHFPICIIYGKMDVKERMEAWRSGADDVIQMPFVIPELLMQIHIRLQKTKLHNTLQMPQTLTCGSNDSTKKDDNDYDILPEHGMLESMPLPKFLSLAFARNSTGVLRLIEGKHIRAFYIKDGHMCGSNSTLRDELLHRYIVKTCQFPGELKRDFKNLSETLSDKALALETINLCGLQPELFDTLAIRHMQLIATGAINTGKGEFDWTPNETPDDFYVFGFQGIHPLHLLLSVIRTNPPMRDYSEMFSNKDLLLVPNESFHSASGLLSMPETSAVAATANGIALTSWLQQSRVVLPYADVFMYIMIQFNCFCTVERNEVDPEEIQRVALPGSENEAKGIGFDPFASIIDIDDTVISQETSSSEQQLNAQLSNELTDNNDVSSSSTPKDKSEKPTIKKAQPIPKKETLLEKELNEINKQQTSKFRRVQPSQSSLLQHKKSGIKSEDIDFSTFLKLDETKLDEGHIWDVHPGAIMALAIKHKKTGVMTFCDAISESRMYWQDGKLLYARSTKPEFRIDQVLFGMGLINKAQKHTAADLWESSGGMRTGTALIQMQMINPIELTEAIKEQIRMIIHDVCAMPAGDFAFRSRGLPSAEYVAFDISTERVFIRSFRSLEQLNELESISSSLKSKFVTKTDAITRAHHTQLEGTDINILNRFRKTASLKSVFADTNIGLQVFKNTVTALYLLDYLGMTGADNAA